MEIWGYPRQNGLVGFRNLVMVIPTVICAVTAAEHISRETSGVVPVSHTHGCGHIGRDLEQTRRTLLGIGCNPNVASVLLLGLGCEQLDAVKMAEELVKKGIRTEALVMQREGGMHATVEKGRRIICDMIRAALREKRVKASLSDLVLAVECGGSDATSGLVANPAVGYASDRIIGAGGTVVISETTEFIGAENLLAERCASPQARSKLLENVAGYEKEILRTGFDLRGAQPSPGNMEGGLTTIEEKSLGCINKGGNSRIMEVVDYAQSPSSRGLIIMNTPGHDVESISGMIAGGAQVVIFTTGRGTPVGSPVAPVIKVTANRFTARTVPDLIDIDVSGVIEGTESMEEAGERVFRFIAGVARGNTTAAEKHGCREFSIWRIGPTT